MASFEEHLTCPVCHGRIVDAKDLPCGHTFCNVCINGIILSKRQSYQNEMECPYCRDITDISELDTTMKPNFMVNNILTAISSPQENMCDRHPRSTRNYFCQQCEVLVCSHCVIKDHYTHAKVPKTLDEMVEIIKAKMNVLILQGEEQEIQHGEYRTSLRTIWSEGDQELQRLENEVMAEYSILQKQLEEQKERLLSSIATMKLDFRKEVGSALSANEELTLRVSESLRTGRENVSTCNPADLVSLFKIWATQLKADLIDEIPSTREEEEALKMVKLLDFQKNTQSQSCTLDIGSIGHREPSDHEGEANDDIEEEIYGAPHSKHGDEVERIDNVTEIPS